MFFEWVLGIGGTLVVLAICALLIALIISIWNSQWALNRGFAQSLEYGVKVMLTLVLIGIILFGIMLGIGAVWTPLANGLIP